MSVKFSIVCDGCGKEASCGSGGERKHAHIIRTYLRKAGWLNGWSKEKSAYDLCKSCRPTKKLSKKDSTAFNSCESMR